MDMETSIQKACKIKKIYEKIWLDIENVTGVGTGKSKDGRICLVISLAKDEPSTRDIFPVEIEGIPVEFRITGEIKPKA